MCVVGNKSKDIGMGIRKSIVVSFLPCLDALWNSILISYVISGNNYEVETDI